MIPNEEGSDMGKKEVPDEYKDHVLSKEQIDALLSATGHERQQIMKELGVSQDERNALQAATGSS